MNCILFPNCITYVEFVDYIDCCYLTVNKCIFNGVLVQDALTFI